MHHEDDRVVEHDGRDDLVHATYGLQEADDPAVERAAGDAEDDDDGHEDEARPRGELRAGPARGERTDEELALRADIEEAGAERDRDRETGEDERDRRDERLGDVIRRAERALDERGVCRDRVVAGEPHEDRSEDEGDEDREERDRRTRGPLEGELTYGRGRAFGARPRRCWLQ